MVKHELYFSNFCKHSAKILEELNRSGLQEKFAYICIDKRVVKNNITYILMPGGGNFPLPPMINRVPVLLLKPNHEILSGNQILDFIKPQAKTIQQEKTMLYSEPNAFSLSKDNGNCYGVMSDNYSFLDMSPEELKAGGNGGVRQMYNYAGLNDMSTMPVEMEQDKKPKMSMSLEQLEQMRNADIMPQQKRK
jgi:hypothetical protein